MYDHNAHVEAWLLSQIKVVGPNHDAAFWGAPDMCYQATIGDYDLDCTVGFGHSPEEARDELMAQMGY